LILSPSGSREREIEDCLLVKGLVKELDELSEGRSLGAGATPAAEPERWGQVRGEVLS